MNQITRDAAFPAAGHRGGAFLIDAAIVVFCAAFVPPEAPYRTQILLLLVLAYFALMPLTPLQATPGKWICRLRLRARDGGRLAWWRAPARAAAMLGWCALPGVLGDIEGVSAGALGAAWIALPLAWAPVGFMPRRESVFDFLCGSVVVRAKADPSTLAQAAQELRLRNIVVALFVTVAAGMVLSIATMANRDMSRRTRIAYAMEATRPLREKIEAFRSREGRWPAPQALGVAEWNPYPAGGGYRLRADGSILISFSVLPGLKGRSIILKPEAAAEKPGKTAWRCSADPLIERRYLPGSCR